MSDQEVTTLVETDLQAHGSTQQAVYYERAAGEQERREPETSEHIIQNTLETKA